MAEDMIGTLFESDATSILDSEASNLLTELESMATTDPGQPPPPQQPQQNRFYDYGAGGGVPAQQMQSPASQAIQSPAGSIHSPGALISPSTSHFGSPPPQPANPLQRQMSASHQYTSYPTQSMQQGTPSPSTSGPLWRTASGQPGYPSPSGPPQSPQRAVAPPYNMAAQQTPAQHGGHMPPPGQHPQQYMGHPGQVPAQTAKPHPSHPSTPGAVPHDPYRHMQPHPQQQMQYRQMTPYMHQGMNAQHMPGSHPQHMVSQQPRMPRPGVAPYNNAVMHQRMPHHSMMGPPAGGQMIPPPSGPSAEPPMHPQHPQQPYRHPHYQQQMAQHNEMLPPGHYPSMNPMRAQMGQQGTTTPYSYSMQQPMPAASQAAYSMPQSSPHIPMASNHPPTQNNGSSLEQLEKMVSPLNQQPGQQPMPSSPMSAGYPSQAPMLSPRAQHVGHPLAPQQDMSPVRPHMMSPQHPGTPQSTHPPVHPQMHNQQQYGVPAAPPQPHLTPLETIANDISMVEHKLNQLKCHPPPYHPEHERRQQELLQRLKELRSLEERLRSLNSQQTMMLDDVKHAQLKDPDKPTGEGSTGSAPQGPGSVLSTSQPSPSLSLADTKPSTDSVPVSAEQKADAKPSSPNTAPQLLPDDSEELSAALSALVDSEELSGSLAPPQLEGLTPQTNIHSSSAKTTNVAQDVSNLPVESKEATKAPADAVPAKFESQLANSEPQISSVSTETLPAQLPAKPEKKAKAKKSKEKSSKSSKKKSKVGAEQPMSMARMAMPVHPHGHQVMASMPHGLPPPPHQAMMQSQAMMQPIAPHPHSTSHPIMFVQSQSGAPVILQQPPGMPSQPNMSGQMLTSQPPMPPYQQAPVGQGHPQMPMHIGMQPNTQPGVGQQLRPIAPRPSLQPVPHTAANIQVTQNGPSSIPSANSTHLPELLEDPDFKISSKGSSFPGSVGEMVDSPALSEASGSTIGKAKKSSGKSSKSSSRKGKKVGPKRPPASLLKLKKRKRKNSDSMSDAEMSPGIAHTPDSDSFGQRRSGRVTKRQKYIDDIHLGISDDESRLREDDSGVIMQTQGAQEEALVVNQYIVEKIMGTREGVRELEPEDGEAEVSADVNKDGEKEGGDTKQAPVQTVKITEYYVKYKNFSYLHCDWRTQEELEVTDKRINQKIKRWQQKQSQTQSYMMNLMDEDELFNPEYVEVDRVLGENRIPPPEGSDEPESVYYLIKWRQLPYEDATWELEEHVDKGMVARYKQYVNPPDKYKRVPMPTPAEWKEIPSNKLYKGDNQLREYQFEGVNWLTFCYYNRRNCILADEMGLGKTVQSISYLQAVFDYGIRGPFLVIAPLSTIGNWIREFDTWTDLNVIVYHGSSTSRAMIQEYDMFYKDSDGQRRYDVFKFNCLITTYEVIIQDVELLTQMEWRICVIDEAHRLKNKNCKLMEGLRCFELEHKVLLSGTPLQNNVEELYSLLHFLEPEQFKSSVDFMTEFGNLQTQGQVHKLKAVLKPMMLRRLKEDVEKNLAPKEETIIEVELTNIQKKYYRAILEKNFQFLSKGGTTANVPNLMNTMMELRKCCNHPYLIDGAEEKIVMDMREKRQSVDGDALAESMVHASGKLVLLDKLLPKLKAGNHKVLIFSQMIRVLDIIEDYLINRKYIYERIDGRIRGNQRQEAIDRFSRPDSDRFVFLLCTRAGGLGINLTAADTCVIYDSDWNPQNDLQAQARCHRIGQKKAVKIYRLICKNTYEREMFDKASLKLGLDKAVLQSMGSNKGETTTANGPAPLSKQEVEQLLKKGAYGALMEDDKAGDQFCEEDIDQILQRRTQVITIESVGAGSTFAKASFSSSGARDDIDINDPEFWQKWAKKAEVETENVKSDLIIAEPRRRKQTKRFGGHGNAQLEEISDLDSSSDSDVDDRKLPIKPLKGRKSRNRKDDDFEIDDNAPPPGCYARPECFKVEKMLLVYGWGRWTDIVRHGGFRRDLDELDVSNISQAILLYSLQHYKGDATIKTFIWDLVMPSENGETKDIKNHQGLAAPTPRGRKQRSRGPGGKKEFEDSLMDVGTPGSAQSEISCVDEKILTCPVNTEMVLSDAGYRKHLIKHSNKVLLRVRMLYYLKQEIIGAQESKVFANTNWSQVDISPVPKCDGEPPTTWWDKDSDKCLLIGVFKHGYEKYNLMRADNSLLFLTVCGPPDGKALRKEQLNEDDDGDKLDDMPNDDDPATPAANHSAAACSPSVEEQMTATKHLPFPSSSDLNTRIRRIISTYQKMSRRKAEAAIVAQEKKNARMERNAALRMRDLERAEKKNARWTRREESDFYRVISSFGVESTRRGSSEQRKRYIWDTFRQLANLNKKDDEMLTDYYESFCFMCRRVCGKLTPLDEVKLPSIAVEPISEERATRCLSRIELLNKIREEVLWHESLTKRLTLCQYSPEIPTWWKPGEHDKDLLIGAAKHGLAHTDQHILYDSKLCFKDLYLKTVTEPNRLKPSTSQTHLDIHPSSTEPTHSSTNPTHSATEPAHLSTEPAHLSTEPAHSIINPAHSSTGPAHSSSDPAHSSHTSVTPDNLQPMEVRPSSADSVKAKKTTLVNGDLHHSKSDIDEESASPVKMEEDKPSDVIAPEQSDHANSVDSSMKQEGDDSNSEVKPETSSSGEIKIEGGDSAMEKSEDVKPSIEEEQDEVKHELIQEGDDKKSLVKNNGLPAAEETSTQFVWPKDRVIYQRLELVCYCIETGEWPTAAVLRKIGGMGLSNALDTPVGTPDPSRVGTPNHSEYSCAMEDDEVESLRLTISRGGSGKARKPKKSRLDLEVDRIARLRDGGESECSQSTPLRGTPDSFMNGSMSSMNLSSEDFLSSFAAPRKKRGRKSKAEKEAEARAAVEQTIAASYRALADLDVDNNTRIPMIDTTDGSRLLGDEAPLFKDLNQWRCEHPQYMVSATDLGASSSSSQGGLAGFSGSSERKGRRSKHESSAEITESQFTSLTGSESVTVIHRETGKKVTGSKAPSLLLLQAWLEKNTQYDVDPKWSTVVKHLLPEHLKGRVYSDKKKRRREEASSSAASSSSMAQAQAAAATQAMLAAAMQSYPMNLGAFGSLASMGMSPSMMGLYGLGMGADAAPDEETVKAMAAAAASTSAHSAFPFSMYNPLFTYSSMLAAQGLGMNASQGYAQALSSAGMLNGLLGLDPAAAALAASGAGMEMDADMAEKLAAMTSANMMEEMQARSKVLEEYSRAVAAAGLVLDAGVSKEPGETSPHTTSKHNRKSAATVTKSSSADDEMPEDLSIKSRGTGDAVSLASQVDGRQSRESQLREGSQSKMSEGTEEMSATTSDKCATPANIVEEASVSDDKRDETVEESSTASPPPQGHLSPEGHSNLSDKSRPESRS